MSDQPISPELALIDPTVGNHSSRKASSMMEPFGTGNPSTPGTNGSPVAAAVQEPPSVEALLFAAGAISADQLGELVRDAVLTQRPVAAIALERGFATRDSLEGLIAASGVPVSVALGEVGTAPSLEFVSLDPEVARPAAAAVQPTVPAVPQAAAAPQTLETANAGPSAVAQVFAPEVPVAPQGEHVAAETVVAPGPGVVSAESVEERIRAIALAMEKTPLPAPLPAEVLLPQLNATLPTPDVTAAFSVFIRLESGDHVEVDTAESFERASELARAIVETVSASGEWPFVSGRFIRPEAVVSVDIERALRA
jgi:hypothetical protein